jgi:hypothetical protein
MPGVIMTNLQRYMDEGALASLAESARAGRLSAYKTVEQGAATSAFLATSPLVDGIGGRYFEDCNEAERVADDYQGSGGVRGYALDPEAAERLWDVSLQMLETAAPLTAA